MTTMLAAGIEGEHLADPPPPSRLPRTLANVLFASVGYVVLRMLIAPVRIKLLTSLLSKEDYGLLTLIMLTVSFITLMLSLGSLEFMLRKLPGRSADYQRTTLSTIAVFFGLLAVLAALAGAGVLAVWQPARLGLRPTDAAACGIILVLTVHLTQCVYYLMGRSDYAQSRLLMLVHADAWFLPLLALMGALRITVPFMLWFWAGWLLLSLALAQYLAGTRKALRCRPSGQRLREVLRFGLPLMPMIMGEWIFQVQDRYVLLSVSGLEAVAHYTLCFNIAWVGVATGTSLMDVLVTEFYKARNRLDSARSLPELTADPALRKAFTLMLRGGLTLSLPIVLALWIGRRPVLLLLSNPKFADAADILPWVAPLPLLYLMVVITGRTLMASDRGRTVGAATLAAAALHLLLNLGLTPVLAERGAALAGCLAYGVLAAYMGTKVRLWRWVDWQELRAGRLAAFTVLTAAGLIAATHGWPGRHFTSLAVSGCISLAAMLGLGLVNRADLHHLSDSIHSPPADPPPQEPDS